jgi:hypothetical protein
VAEHVRVCPGDLDAGGFGEVVQAVGGRVPVHPSAAAVEQDRPAHSAVGCPVDGPADGGRKRDQDDPWSVQDAGAVELWVWLSEQSGFGLDEDAAG